MRPRATPMAGEAAADLGSVRGRPAIASRALAFAQIVDRWSDKGWGFRLVVIGASGSGKSYFVAQLIDYVLATGAATMVFVYDHKDPAPQHVFSDRGVVRASVADFCARPLEPGDPPLVVFHEDGPGDPDSVADLALALAPDEKVFVIIDEVFPDAVTENGRAFVTGQAGPLGRALRAGRSRGMSISYGTQMPQNMPTLVTSLCESVVWFRQQGGALSYVASEKRLPADALAHAETLRTQEESEFLMMVEGNWDGVIYGPR